jgi:hypothetical protein
MTTVMIVKTIESPMSAIRGQVQYGRTAAECSTLPIGAPAQDFAWSIHSLTRTIEEARMASEQIRDPVVDAVGGTSVGAHRAGLARLFQAGARPVSSVELVCELQRDWARTATVASFKKLMFGPGDT